MSELKKYARWAEWEAAILLKVKDPQKCQEEILRRQQEVDDDQDESHLIATHIRSKLARHGQNPESCCLFISATLLAEWISEVNGEKKHATKITPYLRMLSIPELSRATRSAKAAGWIWRGAKAKKTQNPVSFDKLKHIPR